ncbi:MAG TPA: hydroxymethylbilane synthase [Bacillota bacterium]|nr:hydroxymethylbilane synthase [Bacillota bacterium]
MQRKLRIGTRGSKLALWQTEKVKGILLAAFPELPIEVITYKTLGDRHPELNLLQNQGKGVFCSEIEQALLNREIELAVHSVKDLPGELPEGLMLVAYLEREDPREVLIGWDGQTLENLVPGAVVGTSSIRRLLQLKRLRPDLEFAPIRGNVETRIRKVREGQYAATILALAGVRRIGLEEYISQTFELNEIIPAPGQGCIGIEICTADFKLQEMLHNLNHNTTEIAVRAERAFLRRMGGNCESASGAYARWVDGQIEMIGMYGRNAQNIVVKTIAGPAGEAEALGVHLAEGLLNFA